ncbi:MAG TPA: hypothetical protein VJP80_03635 [Candidatus Saccharimonadales bacterium]|nr:hypothetical protein [Candidatus Saccharimonadales bacterium]
MKTLGLIGGMSWESTAHYYSRINQLVAERLGGLHSARLLLYSLDFDELQRLQHTDDWAGESSGEHGSTRRISTKQRLTGVPVFLSSRSISSHRVRPAGG